MRLKEAWESFVKNVMPAAAPAIQHQEMRRAFYAGAYSMLVLVTEAAPDSISEDEGVALLEGLAQECAAFHKTLAEGKA
jgi:hypothetical protein